jgi:transcriptional regulator with GAF, ATPase, and Fis domain
MRPIATAVLVCNPNWQNTCHFPWFPNSQRLVLSKTWCAPFVHLRQLATQLLAGSRKPARAQILAEDNLITFDDLPESIVQSAPVAASQSSNPLDLRDVERRHVQQVLQQAHNNKVNAAKMLGISRRALYRLIDKYGLEAKRSEAQTNSAV